MPTRFGTSFFKREKTLLPFLRAKPPKLVLQLSPVNETHFSNKSIFVKVSFTSFAIVKDVSFVVLLTSSSLDCRPPFIQSKYWITIGKSLIEWWLLPSVATPRYIIPCSRMSLSAYWTVIGESTLLTIASTLVRAQEYFFEIFESGNNFLIKVEVQSLDL